MHPHLQHVLNELDRLERRAIAAVAGLTPVELRRKPADGGWSIAEVFEHLCLADQSYVDGVLPPAIARAQKRDPARPFRRSFVGRLLLDGLRNGSRRLKAPRLYRVGGVRDDVVEVWRNGMARLRRLLLAADGSDLRTRVSSPVARFLLLNVGDALEVPVVHGHRHLDQVERLRAGLQPVGGVPSVRASCGTTANEIAAGTTNLGRRHAAPR